MKKIFLSGLLISATSFLFGQKIDALINSKEAERIEKTLQSDDMRGRRAFTPDIDRAADFIAAEFKAIGLQTWNNSGSYRQEFAMVRPKFISASATFDGVNIDTKNIIVVTLRAMDVTSVLEVQGIPNTNIKIRARTRMYATIG